MSHYSACMATINITNSNSTIHIPVYVRLQGILQILTVQVTLHCMYDYKAY